MLFHECPRQGLTWKGISKQDVQALIQLTGNCDVGDFMIVIDLKYWWQTYNVGDFFHHVGDLCYQHPKVVKNTFRL